jgi:hypothetical protein
LWLVLRAPTTPVQTAAPIQNILDTTSYRREKLLPMPAIELRFLGSPARTFVAVPTHFIPEFTLSLSEKVIQIRDFPYPFAGQTNTEAGGLSR